MERKSGVIVLAVLALGAVGLWMWSNRYPPQEHEIRTRLDAFTATFNAAAGDGLGSLAQAARLGQFFTDDVVVELGKGSPPIQGRDTLMGMSARLQPRTAEFLLELVDVTVMNVEDNRAELSLTAVLRRRSRLPGGESLDAREFSVEIRKPEGVWQVSRVVAIDTLR